MLGTIGEQQVKWTAEKDDDVLGIMGDWRGLWSRAGAQWASARHSGSLPGIAGQCRALRVSARHYGLLPGTTD